MIKDKKATTALYKIKNFIAINKNPVIIQTDNGLEFKNQLISDYLKQENIKHIFSRPHHPQTNWCLERYHHELHKFMIQYLIKCLNLKVVINLIYVSPDYFNKIMNSQ